MASIKKNNADISKKKKTISSKAKKRVRCSKVPNAKKCTAKKTGAYSTRLNTPVVSNRKTGTIRKTQKNDELIVKIPETGQVFRFKKEDGLRYKAVQGGKLKELSKSFYERVKAHERKRIIDELVEKGEVKYVFDSEEIRRLLIDNKEFLEHLSTGHYVYCDGRIILNDSRYVKLNNDFSSLQLTEEALYDPRGCCLIIYTKSGSDDKQRIIIPDKIRELESMKTDTNPLFNSLSDILLDVGNGNGGDIKPPDNFDGDNESDDDDGGGESKIRIYKFVYSPPKEGLEFIIKEQIKKEKTSINKLAEKLGISDATISRFWTDPDSRPDLANVVAVCLALHMVPHVSKQVIYLTGYTLRNTPLERVYEALLDAYYTDGIEACNELLKLLGFDSIPLTSTKFS